MELDDFMAKYWEMTADELAEALRALGIKGQRENCRDCPLARLVKKHLELGDKSTVDVGDEDIEIRNADAPPYSASMSVGMSEFVDRFDRGRIPDLVDA